MSILTSRLILTSLQLKAALRWPIYENKNKSLIKFKGRDKIAIRFNEPLPGTKVKRQQQMNSAMNNVHCLIISVLQLTISLSFYVQLHIFQHQHLFLLFVLMFSKSVRSNVRRAAVLINVDESFQLRRLVTFWHQL